MYIKQDSYYDHNIMCIKLKQKRHHNILNCSSRPHIIVTWSDLISVGSRGNIFIWEITRSRILYFKWFIVVFLNSRVDLVVSAQNSSSTPTHTPWTRPTQEPQQSGIALIPGWPPRMWCVCVCGCCGGVYLILFSISLRYYLYASSSAAAASSSHPPVLLSVCLNHLRILITLSISQYIGKCIKSNRPFLAYSSSFTHSFLLTSSPLHLRPTSSTPTRPLHTPTIIIINQIKPKPPTIDSSSSPSPPPHF